MNKQQFTEFFQREVMPALRAQFEADGVPDYPARSEEWNNLVDMFIKDGKLPEHAGDWAKPAFVDRRNHERWKR